MKLTPREDGWTLPVAGQPVTRLCIDSYEVRILFGNLIEIAIAEPFALTRPGGPAELLDPAADPASLAPVLHVVRQAARHASALAGGRLDLTFAVGTSISVPPGTDYEPWTLAGPGGPDGLKIVSLPGGDLAIWPDRRQP